MPQQFDLRPGTASNVTIVKITLERFDFLMPVVYLLRRRFSFVNRFNTSVPEILLRI